MGARQSYQTDIDRRPRSNSTVETGIEVHNGSGRRTMSRYRHNANNGSSECDYEEGEDLTSEFANFAVSSTTSQSVSTPTPSGDVGADDARVASSAPSPSHRRPPHGHHHHHHHRSTMNNNSGGTGGGMRFSLRASTRNSLLQALTGITTAATSGSSAAATATTSSSSAIWTGATQGRDIKCPICHKKIPSDEVEVHLVMCFTRPRIAYNDDVLESNKGECSICLDEMSVGDTIARLPCLCIYHKTCIDEWFQRKNCCPEHPGDD